MTTVEYLHRAELTKLGMGRGAISAAVALGDLIRARRDHYLPGGTADEIVQAVRVGGRLTCLSLLSMLGVFVRVNTRLHVHMRPTASRMRAPTDRRKRLGAKADRNPRLHWLPLREEPGQAACVSILDALAHAVLCQAPRDAIATFDSALNKGLVTMQQIRELAPWLPRRYAAMLPLIDGRAESGPETLLRLMARSLGCKVELQVAFEGIGRVDLVIDGWLVIECDSRGFHTGWESQERDRRRDILLAALGYTTLRPTANMIMSQPELVLAALKAMLATRQA